MKSNNVLEQNELGKQEDGLLIPTRLTIETMFGCNASCIMCPIDVPTERKKGEMPIKMSNYILDEFTQYTDLLEKLDFFGLGEPLLDRHIFQRIKYAKKRGFRSIAFSTNAQLLDSVKQKKLLDTGIDTVIFSIDGIKKKTHEAIRKRLNYDQVLENCQSIIRMRDDQNYKTRFLVRFISQETNRDEWEDYKALWQSILSKERNDLLGKYDVHSWAGEVSTKEDVLGNGPRDPAIETMTCHHLWSMVILADGTVPLCSEDVLHGKFNLGNVKDENPITIFNNQRYAKIRNLHKAGKKSNLKICRECTILYSEKTRQLM